MKLHKVSLRNCSLNHSLQANVIMHILLQDNMPSCTGWIFLSECSTNAVKRLTGVCSAKLHSAWWNAASRPLTLPISSTCGLPVVTSCSYQLLPYIHLSAVLPPLQLKTRPDCTDWKSRTQWHKNLNLLSNMTACNATGMGQSAVHATTQWMANAGPQVLARLQALL